jgi:predicted RNA binding protein YcfA (HicA-like mRNA interferase family)
VLIKADGWFLVRTKGDHRQYHHPSKPGTVTVPGKPSDEVPPGTLNSILTQAGLKGD